MTSSAWGWNVYEINGNDVDQIRGALTMAQNANGKPTLIIGKCIMGKGALKADGTSYERNCKTHGAPLGGDAYVNTIKALGGDPENPFQIFPEVKKLYADRAKELRKIMDAKYARKAAWEKAPARLPGRRQILRRLPSSRSGSAARLPRLTGARLSRSPMTPHVQLQLQF